MDNLCHTLVGAAIAEAGLKTRTRFGAVALMVSANIPDLDVLSFLTDTSPVSFRRGWTHGILAQMALPVVLTGAFWMWNRWRKPASTAAHSFHAGWLLALCFIGVYTHVCSRLLEQLRRPAAHASRLALVLRRLRVHRRYLAMGRPWRRRLDLSTSTFDKACHVHHRNRHGLYPGDAVIRTRRTWHRCGAVDRGARLSATGADGRSETNHSDITRSHRRCRRPLRVGIVFMALEAGAESGPGGKERSPA